MMNMLAFKRLSTRFLLTKSLRPFSTLSHTATINEIVDNFQQQGDPTVTNVAQTMDGILRVHISQRQHQDYSPVANELAYYVTKLLS